MNSLKASNSHLIRHNILVQHTVGEQIETKLFHHLYLFSRIRWPQGCPHPLNSRNDRPTSNDWSFSIQSRVPVSQEAGVFTAQPQRGEVWTSFDRISHSPHPNLFTLILNRLFSCGLWTIAFLILRIRQINLASFDWVRQAIGQSLLTRDSVYSK